MDLTRLKSSHWVDPRTHVTFTTRTVTEPVRMHLHEYYEIEVVLSGAGCQNLNGTLYPMEPGSVYFLTPIDFHSVTPEPSLEIANLSFEEHILSPEIQMCFANRRDNLIFQADSLLSDQLLFLFGMLSRESAMEDSFSLQMRQNLLETLLITVLRHRQAPAGRQLSNPQIYSAMQYLFRHFRENITLAQLAEQSGYTPNYFSKLFREVCGACFVAFLTGLRLNYAKMLLLSTALSTTEIAEKSGFGSASGLFRSFRQHCGCTPDSFRRQKSSIEFCK